MRFESTAFRRYALSATLIAAQSLHIAPEAQGQTPPAPQEPSSSAQGPAAPPPLPPRSQDYPDPRTISFGIFYWAPLTGQQPDLLDGKTATGAGSLYGLGKPKKVPGVYADVPITRTGTIRLELFQLKGAGNQTLTGDDSPLGLGYSKGDYLATSYRFRGGKVYLDDLFWPHKFPVAKFRLKSLWGLEYIQARVDINAPFKPTTSSIATWSTNGTRQLVLPSLGMAAEYAVARHVLLRVNASGMAFPHHAWFWDGDATISARFGHVEVLGGFKVLDFRTSPSSDFYVKDLVSGGYAGLLWHW